MLHLHDKQDIKHATSRDNYTTDEGIAYDLGQFQAKIVLVRWRIS